MHVFRDAQQSPAGHEMEDLSSRLTFFFKVVFPTFWIGAFALATLFMFVSPESFQGDSDVRELRQGFLFLTVAGSTFFYLTCLRAKRVLLDGDDFVVSNYRRSIRIPVRSVERASASILLTPELMWLHLRESSDFGDRIMFIPGQRLLGGYTRHPLAKRLNRLIAEASTGI